MKVLLSWLNELAPLGDDVDALSAVMTDLGLAVEGIERVGAPIPGVVVAEVLALRPHPDADRVQLVDVDPGDGSAPLQIGCGAFNMAVGDFVPLATIGTVMPGGVEIARRKLRGEWSNGMLCSPRELGLGDDHAGIWILPPGLPLGAPVSEALGMLPDVVFDLDLTRNRPDAWSHLGVARDVAARLGVPFSPAVPQVKVEGEAGVSVEILDPERCGRFLARTIRGVTVGPSPRWLAERLSRVGMRPINNVVDASNYVMLELGQPNHPYDARLVGGGGFRVRTARESEQLETLDGVVRTMTAEDLLICDASDTPVGIAGIMGGEHSGIADSTTDVILEAAWFEPVSIAATVARTGLRSDASARFERGVDPELAERATARFVELLRHTSPDATVSEPVDVEGTLPPTVTATLRTARVNALLGVELGDAEIAKLLEPIGFEVEPDGDGRQTVTVPSWRLDCTDEIDFVEEVARHHGYGKSPPVVARSVHGGALTPYQRDRRLLREVLVGLGAIEVMPNPFLAPGDLERAGLDPTGLTITNPLAAEESVLRTALRPGLLKAVAYNASHRLPGVQLFEVGQVFWPRPGPTDTDLLPDEREMLAVALAGAEAPTTVGWWHVLGDALVVQGEMWRLEAAEAPGLHPTRTARIVSRDGAAIGWVGEVDPGVLDAHGIAERVAWLEVDLAVLLGLPHGVARYQPVSRFPSSDIDLAFTIADDVPAASVEAALRAGAGDLLVSIGLFDVFRGPSIGEGRRSLAYRLRLQASDRTLSDTALAAVRQRCIDTVAAVGGELR